MGGWAADLLDSDNRGSPTSCMPIENDAGVSIAASLCVPATEQYHVESGFTSLLHMPRYWGRRCYDRNMSMGGTLTGGWATGLLDSDR